MEVKGKIKGQYRNEYGTSRVMSLLFLLTSFLFPLTSVHSQTRQQWRDSLEVLNARIAKDPGNLNLHLLKAEANINLEQWDYALAEYGKILHTDNQNLAALYFRAYVHIQQHHYDLARVGTSRSGACLAEDGAQDGYLRRTEPPSTDVPGFG